VPLQLGFLPQDRNGCVPVVRRRENLPLRRREERAPCKVRG
jgi:hypothetical protein